MNYAVIIPLLQKLSVHGLANSSASEPTRVWTPSGLSLWPEVPQCRYCARGSRPLCISCKLRLGDLSGGDGQHGAAPGQQHQAGHTSIEHLRFRKPSTPLRRGGSSLVRHKSSAVSIDLASTDMPCECERTLFAMGSIHAYLIRIRLKSAENMLRPMSNTAPSRTRDGPLTLQRPERIVMSTSARSFFGYSVLYALSTTFDMC
jgi:hypothetical protein